jgi:hypothetical protein
MRTEFFILLQGRLAGLLDVQSHRPAYQCRHGHTTASTPDLSRPKNAHIREGRILAHLPALHLLLTGTSPAAGRRRRTRRGTDVRPQDSPEDVTVYLREQQITLTYDPAGRTPRAGTGEAATGHSILVAIRCGTGSVSWRGPASCHEGGMRL